MARAECGSSRCTCDHSTCDVGWFTVTRPGPTPGSRVEASVKCLRCFPTSAPSTSSGRTVDARELGSPYADHMAAAAGDRD